MSQIIFPTCNAGVQVTFSSHCPADEFGSMQDGGRTPDLKRKRNFSNQSSPSQPSGPVDNHFLYQKLIDVTKELEAQKMQNSNFQSESISRQNQMPRFPAQSLPGITARQNATAQPPRQPSHFAMFPGQAQPSDPMTGQAHPTVHIQPLAGWGVQGHGVPQWGTGQEFYQANH